MSGNDVGLSQTPLFSLPAEVWSHLALLACDRDLPSAFSLVRTCSVFWNSLAGEVVRYLHALTRYDLPRPTSLPSDLVYEEKLLQRSRWPGRLVPERLLGGDAGDARSRHWTLCGGPNVAAFDNDDRTRLQLLALTERGLEQTMELNCEDSIEAWDVDTDAGVAVCLFAAERKQATAEERVEETNGDRDNASASTSNGLPSENFSNGVQLPAVRIGQEPEPPMRDLSLALYDCRTGKLKIDKRHESTRPCTQRTTSVEVCGDYVLLRAGGYVEVLQWRQDGGGTAWQRVWSRAPNVFPVLTAHLIGLDVVMVLSQPSSSEHGTDWASTIELYRFSQAQPKIADIQLPVRARPARGLSYIQTGLGKRLRSRTDNALVIVCVEGYIWVSDLRPFMELLFPQSALSLFGASHPTLDSHWVRAHMHKCSLSARDTFPISLSVSGWRVAAVWSRAVTNRNLVGPKQQEGGSKAAFVRLLDADPRNTDSQKVTTRDQRPEDVVDAQGEPLVHTMFTGDRFCSYADHNLGDHLDVSSLLDLAVLVEGARLLLGSTRQSMVMVPQ